MTEGNPNIDPRPTPPRFPEYVVLVGGRDGYTDLGARQTFDDYSEAADFAGFLRADGYEEVKVARLVDLDALNEAGMMAPERSGIYIVTDEEIIRRGALAFLHGEDIESRDQLEALADALGVPHEDVEGLQ